MIMEEPGDKSVTIRSFRRSDGPACRRLYSEGLLGGKLAENDTAADIDDIEAAYLRSPGNHFWVAVDQQGQVVGMIGVQHHEQGKAEIRRLRVREDLGRRGEIGTRLLETALRFCQEQHYLKVTLDTFIERESAIRLFEKFRFRLDRAKTFSGKDLLYFYLDLYGAERRKG